jgi:hypothetical protein
MRRLRFERRCACAFSDSISRAEAYLRRNRRVLRVPVQLGPLNMQLKRTVTVGITVSRDVSDAVRIHDAMHLEVRPLGGLPFPHMRVHLTVRPQIPPGTRLMLELSYTAPLRLVGYVFDWLVGRRVAASIANALLDELCAELSTRRTDSEPRLTFHTVTPIRESSDTSALR